MSRRYRLLILLTCVALACAGLPAHACADATETEADAQIEVTAEDSALPCPHHAPPVSETVTHHPDASMDGEDSSCCGLDCSCRCGATAPALTLPASLAEPISHGATLTFAAVLSPSLSPERLLRPPIVQA